MCLAGPSRSYGDALRFLGWGLVGPAKVKELKHNQSNIKRELVKQMHETLDMKVFLLLDALLPKQVAIPKKEIVEKLEMVYKGVKIQKKAKATDIKA